MNRFGLALSGGGFRAVLYHLGLVRFLRDAGILHRVTHICSVSGGSIMAAHMVLNWDRYNGSTSEFDAAASEILSFVRLDVRNRVIRRYPLSLPLHWPRRFLGLPNRKLTRTGLLEYHYEKYLYGDTSLFELPERPELHILATNLNKGCLCSFNRNGLLMMHRQSGQAVRFDRIHVGLATVPMAVTASSAFPGFFPPLELTGADVGASSGEFGRQAYTDGGVFDNLGVRMFRYLERPLLAESPLSCDDFLDFQAVVEALCEAGKSSEETPLRRLGQIMVAGCSRPDSLLLTNGRRPEEAGLQPIPVPGEVGTQTQLNSPQPEVGQGERQEVVPSILSDVLRQYPLHREPLFARLRPMDPDAQALLHAVRPTDRVLETGDQAWLNRHLLEAAFRQATGHPCFRRLNSALDGILVSDVGKRMEARGNQRAGGLIRTALRATDIVMDRVWQLEADIFQGTPGFVFAPSTDVVDPAEDPTALHPEVQRQAVGIRTDFDRFATLEIRSLVRHGYCVGRKACRAHPDLFGAGLPVGAPWDPIPGPRATALPVSEAMSSHRPSAEPVAATVEARTLQASAGRRVWSTLLDRRDWISFVYVPLIIPILVMVPYLVVKSHQRSQRINHLVESLSQGSRDLENMSRLLETRPTPVTGVAAEEVHSLDEPDFQGFEILQDSRIVDLRGWRPVESGKSDPGSWMYNYRRLKVAKQSKSGANRFRVQLLPTSPKTGVRFPPQQLQPKLLKADMESSVPGQKECRWQASFDFQKVAAGDFVDLIVEYDSPGRFLQRGESSTAMPFQIQAETAELTTWVLMPEGQEYRTFRIIRYKTGKPEEVEAVKVVTEYLAEDFTILAFKLLSLKPGYTYEVSWSYR
ncbi:MAG: patatin-like phospholipase family protein [Planctomycetaceae bacterium]|nr:patatin-like phospholipase family protein [Planctomycetaceae bacterium]